MSSTSNYDITAMGTGQFTPTPSSLWRQLAQNKEFREEFGALQLKRGVAFQIRALLKKRGWTQSRLAVESKLTQGVVSRAQNPDYGNLTINTINRIAGGFDVAFIGRFVPFSELVDWFENLSEQVGDVEPFEREYRQIFQKGRLVRARTRRRPARKRVKRNLMMRTKRLGVSMGRQQEPAGETMRSGVARQPALFLKQGLARSPVIPMTPKETPAPVAPYGITTAGGGTNQWQMRRRNNR